MIRLAAVVALALLNTAPAMAHDAPALPALFEPPRCITVVDKGETAGLHVGYAVSRDDSVLEQGDLELSDALTHQFIAFRGRVSLQSEGVTYADFALPGDDIVLLPLWIAADDLQRASQAAAVGGVAVEPGATTGAVALEDDADFDGRWLRITADADRVPITLEQAALGLDWDLTDVPPGVYTINGYIFSPPFNGWSPRPGVVKVVDGDDDPPALTLSPVKEFLYTYAGRRITGCVDAPQGSTLSASVRFDELPQDGFEIFAEDVPLDADGFELCYFPDSPFASGNARIRLELTTPGGDSMIVISEDTITVLPGEGECEESEAFCCAKGAVAADVAADAGAVVGVDGGASGQDDRDASGCGCHLVPRSSPATAGLPWAALLLLRRRR